MKKSIIVVVIIVIIGLIIWGVSMNRGSVNSPSSPAAGDTGSPASSAPVTETTKVSDKLSQYKNEELGFSVSYPSSWEADNANTGVTFIIPQGTAGTTSLGKLQATVMVTPGKCSFPPVITVKDRTTVTSGALSFNSISIANSVQGRAYFDRLFNLQHQDICYNFDFSSISLSPASKGIKGSEATQMANNNKAVIDAADQAFTSVVKSFAYVVSDPGKPETSVVPATK